MKINNSLDVARWEKLECKCNMNNETECFPFVKCEHCRCKKCWDSVPQENFKVKELIIKNNKPTGETKTRTVKEITLVRGGDLEDVIGWQF
jgi:hypothetical protein